jgi:hypothetical protein
MIWSLKTKLTKEDYERLNPPAILAYKEGVGMFQLRLDNDERWLMVGHVPKPKTKLGWFIYHIVHGLAMRYPLLAVIRWSFANMDISEREKANAMRKEDA